MSKTTPTPRTPSDMRQNRPPCSPLVHPVEGLSAVGGSGRCSLPSSLRPRRPHADPLGARLRKLPLHLVGRVGGHKRCGRSVRFSSLGVTAGPEEGESSTLQCNFTEKPLLVRGPVDGKARGIDP